MKKKIMIISGAILIGLFVGLFLFGAFNDYDKSILKNAKKFTENSGFIEENNPFLTEERTFSVVKNGKSFNVTINGKMKQYKYGNFSNEKFKPKKISNVTNKKHQKIISSSKKMIYSYIKKSKILKNKDEIEKYIDSLDFKIAVYGTAEENGAYFSPEDNTIYIHKNTTDLLSEWMLVHECVHAISYCTHEYNIKNEEFAFNQFNEILTDIIASSMNPKIQKDYQSGYQFYYTLVYPYVNLFKLEAINAYFYGYDNIYKSINKDELEFLIFLLDDFNVDFADLCYTNLIFKWTLDLQN